MSNESTEYRAALFLESRPDIAAWFKANMSWDVCADIYGKLFEYGQLTQGQIEMIERQIARNAAKGGETDVDLRALTQIIPDGRYGVPDTDDTNRLKVRVKHVSDPDSRWNGWIFVNDAAEYGRGKKYGSQKPGGMYKGEIAEELKAIIADHIGALRKYGALTSTCGNCGRPLEDKKSVEFGIGPTCRKNLGIG